MRLTIRDVLWLTALVGVLVAWQLERKAFRRAIGETEALAKERERTLVAAKKAIESDLIKLRDFEAMRAKDMSLMLKRLKDRNIDYRELLENPTSEEKRTLGLGR